MFKKFHVKTKYAKKIFGFFSEFLASLIDDHIEARVKNNLIFEEEETKHLQKQKMDQHPIILYMMKKMEERSNKN